MKSARNLSKRSFLGCIAAAALAGLIVNAGADEEKGEWRSLLEGDDFSEHWHTTGNWKMEDGVITLTPRPGESGWSRWTAYLWSKEKYDDFEIQFDYKVEPKGNSGFYFNVGDKDDPVAKGIEVQIYDSHGAERLTDHTSGGVIPRIPPRVNAVKAPGEWNTFHITVKGDKLTVRLNGKEVNEVSLSHPELKGRPSEGYIGFQDHGLPLSLRNIKIRKL